MSFEGGFHGRLFGSLSTTHTKALHKVDIPAFSNWVASPFPNLKYPLDRHQAENDKEEARCLAIAEEKMTPKSSGTPVVALIVEPIQSEGGDNHASPKFFQGLRDLTKKHGILMIVDEVQTGVGPTGDFWAHEAWNLTVSCPLFLVYVLFFLFVYSILLLMALNSSFTPLIFFHIFLQTPPDIVTFSKKFQAAG
jgi:4-aminobutyrate aminotransferase/(S)-3-amino-2-methylpropionate transaminase